MKNGSIDKTIRISERGKYKFQVRNNSSVAVKVCGFVRYYSTALKIYLENRKNQIGKSEEEVLIMKKKLISLLLSFVMCLSFGVSATAIDLNLRSATGAEVNALKQSLTNVSETVLVIDGKNTVLTSGYDEFGRYVAVADNGEVQSVAVAIDANNTQVSRYENGMIATHDVINNAVDIQTQSIEPRITISGSDLYWVYAYSSSDAEEIEEGLLWDLDCGSPLNDNFYGYDDNDMTARTYAEDFMDYVNTMEAKQREARTINANEIDNSLSSIISICTDPTQVLSAIASSNASVREAEDAIHEASQAAKQAL